jgi:methylated-DNA-protein-cysteine methyltransferase-like protein
MAKSPFFERIKGDVLKIVAVIPEGKVTTYASIGEHLDVVPRHVAYILPMLSPPERLQVPWFRVVGGDGGLGKVKRAESGQTQADLLRSEGLLVIGNSLAHCLDRVLVSASGLNSGVSKQVRPPDAPPAKARRIRPSGK